MVLAISLESFDNGHNPDATVTVATYEEGYVAGQAAAQVQIEAEQTNLKETLVQTLNDSVFSYQEAQAHFVSGMQRYVAAILDTIIPATLTPALHAHLAQILAAWIEADAHAPITLKVSSDQAGVVGDLVAEMGLPHITVETDPDLTAHAAFVSSPERELSLDLEAALLAIAEKSQVLIQPMQEVAQNG